MSKGIECPHCHEHLSAEYAVKSLSALAKSQGHDFDEELDALVEGTETDGLYAEEPSQEDGTEKAVQGVGNKVNSNRGKRPGTFVEHPRVASGPTVDRKIRPTNKTSQGGLVKSLRLPVVVGDVQLVQYSMGNDVDVSKSLENGGAHVPPARNMRAEQDLAMMSRDNKEE